MNPLSLPSSRESIWAVWMRNFLLFRKTWLVSVFWILLEPLFLLGALGYGLGSFVPQVQGMSYLEFFFPALLCNSAMMVAYFECTYPTFTKLTFSRVYGATLLSPVMPSDLLYGEVLWGATKSIFSVVGVILIAAVLGAMGSAKVLFALPILFLLGAVFGQFGMLVTSTVKNYDQIIYPSSGLIIPLSLFSGTYFPLDSMPKFFQWLAYLSPLTHAVAATRAIQHGELSASLVLNVGVLILLFLILNRITQKKFFDRLID